MADDWLQRYLNARLLDIGDDDVKLEFLRKAARDIGQHLVEHAADVPRFTLVALDPDVPPDEPVLEQAEDVIIKHWNTLRGRYSDRPRQLIRAVLLEALSLAGGEDDPRFAAIIALTGTSFRPASSGSVSPSPANAITDPCRAVSALLLLAVFALLPAAAKHPASRTAELAAQQIPTPASVYGFEPGTNGMLGSWDQIVEFLTRLGAASDA